MPDGHPQVGQEILPLAPSRWYLTSFLAPQGGRAPEVDDRDSTDEGIAGGSEEPKAEDAGTDDPEPKRPVRFPPSMGLSAFLPLGKSDAIEVDVWYADYDKIELPHEHSDRALCEMMTRDLRAR